MGRLLFLLLFAAGAAAPAAEAPEAEAPDGLLVMGTVERGGSVVHAERAVVADPRTGRVRSRRLPGGTLCYGEVMAAGSRVLYPGHRGRRSVQLSLPLSLVGAPRVLPEPHRVDGLPHWSAVHATIGDRLLIESGRRVMLWDPRRDRPTRTIRDGWLVAAGSSSFAWCTAKCRAFRVWSETGERRFEPPSGAILQGGDGALSPDGSRLAVPVTMDGVTRTAVLDLATESWTLVPDGRLPDSYVALAWSPSGEWLYFAGRGRGLFGWRAGSAAAVRLPADPGATVMSIATTTG
jgi:hypothetical protein